MADDSEPTPPGWYRQPEDPEVLRWWDGDDWTDDTMPVPDAEAPRTQPRPRVRREPVRAQPVGGDDSTPPTPRRTRRDTMAQLRAHPEVEADPAIAVVAVEPEPEPERRPEPVMPVEPNARPRPAPRPSPTAPTARPSPAPKPRVQRPAVRAPKAVDGSPSYRRPADEVVWDRPRPREHPRHLDEERRGSRLAAPVSPAAARSILKIAVRAGLIAVLVAIAWVGFVKLRDASPSDAATLSKDPTPVTVAKGAPRLDQILLTLSDLPRGWEAQATDPSSDDICDGRIPRSVIEPTELQSAAFTKGDTGALIGNVVQEFSDDSAAEAFMDLTARVVDSCREYSTDQASVRLSPMDFPRFGDETFVAEASGDAPGGALHGAIVYVRKANRVASVITITFGDSAVNTELIEHLTDVVSRRMSSKPAIDQPIDSGGDGGGGATLPGDDG